MFQCFIILQATLTAIDDLVCKSAEYWGTITTTLDRRYLLTLKSTEGAFNVRDEQVKQTTTLLFLGPDKLCSLQTPSELLLLHHL